MVFHPLANHMHLYNVFKESKSKCNTILLNHSYPFPLKDPDTCKHHTYRLTHSPKAQ